MLYVSVCVCISCAVSDLLDIEFVSNDRLSLAVQTRLAKFDEFPHVYISCVAQLCPRQSSKTALDQHQHRCDRSCLPQPDTGLTYTVIDLID